MTVNKQNSKQMQEYEFVMEGITTRMQMAMEKIAESNRMWRSAVKLVCIVMLVVVLVVVSGFIVYNQIWIGHVNNLRNTMIVSEVAADEEIPQFRSNTVDR